MELTTCPTSNVGRERLDLFSLLLDLSRPVSSGICGMRLLRGMMIFETLCFCLKNRTFEDLVCPRLHEFFAFSPCR